MMFIGRKGEPAEIDIRLIQPNPDQPRKQFEQEELDELCDSIREFGIIQPLIVKKDRDAYILIAGERRLRAAASLGMTTVPAVIREASDKESALIALIENVQRENLSYIEEAQAYRRLITEHGLTQTEVAKKVGKRQSTISNKLRLLSLPSEIVQMLLENNLSERHARALLRIDDDAVRKQLLDKIVKYNLNVTQSEKLVSDFLEKEKKKQMTTERIRFINYKLYVNTIRKAFQTIHEAEKDAVYSQEDLGDSIELKIVIPKKNMKDESDFKPALSS